jgi:hypothetical protein
MLFREVIAVYTENRTKHIIHSVGKVQEFLMLYESLTAEREQVRKIHNTSFRTCFLSAVSDSYSIRSLHSYNTVL